METDKLKLKSKPFTTINVNGVVVEVRIAKYGKNAYFNAYANLTGSNILSDSFLGHPTYRKGDWVGVDTNHSFNDNQTSAGKLASALNQIEGVIKAWQEATSN